MELMNNGKWQTMVMIYNVDNQIMDNNRKWWMTDTVQWLKMGMTDNGTQNGNNNLCSQQDEWTISLWLLWYLNNKPSDWLIPEQWLQCGDLNNGHSSGILIGWLLIGDIVPMVNNGRCAGNGFIGRMTNGLVNTHAGLGPKRFQSWINRLVEVGLKRKVSLKTSISIYSN